MRLRVTENQTAGSQATLLHNTANKNNVQIGEFKIKKVICFSKGVSVKKEKTTQKQLFTHASWPPPSSHTHLTCRALKPANHSVRTSM